MISLFKKSRGGREKNAKRLILSLRWLIIIVLSFLFLYSEERESIKSISYFNWLLLFYILTNIFLIFVHHEIFMGNAIRSSIFLFDTLFISVLIYLASGANIELYMAYFFVIFMAAMGQSIILSLVITFFISVLYIAILMQTMTITNIFNTSILIRIPFLFGVSLFSSYFAQEARRYKEHLIKVEHLYEEVKSQLFQSSKLASVGTLSSGIVHEIGNLLQIIMGSAESIKRHMDRTADNEKRINDICSVAEQGGQISRGLLAFSRQNVSEHRRLDVKALLDECYELARYSLEKGSVKYEKQYDERACNISGNGNQIKQVVINFINNAKDAMQGGGKLVVSCKPDGNKILIEISDSGTGIPERIKNTIFSPFFTTKKEGKGTGLGLSISRDIITMHNGTIDFDSREGEGTTFRLILPREEEQ